MHCCIGCISAIDHSRIIQGRHPWRSGKIGETRIKMRIKFDEPIIGKDNVLEIDSKDLDDFYVSASDIDRMSLFFILLTSLHYYEENGEDVEALKAFCEKIQERRNRAAEIADDIFPIDFHIYEIKWSENDRLLASCTF